MKVTKKAIADYLGISRTAVSLVLNNAENCTISQETRENILKAARELGYWEQTEVYKKICYVLYKRKADDPRYMINLMNFERICSNSGYTLVFINQPPDSSNFNKLVNFLNRQEVEGAVLVGDIDDDIIEVMNATKVPYVVCGGISRNDIDIIEQDAKKISYNAIEHLIKLGHRKVAFFSGTLDLLVHHEILQGYIKALKKYGILYDQKMVQISNTEDGYELANRMALLKIDYTAAFCVNTIIQFRAVQWLKENGINVPKKVSVLGYGMSELVELSNPKLTTFSFDYKEYAKITFERLVSVINNRKQDKKTIYLNNVKYHNGGTVSSCLELKRMC